MGSEDASEDVQELLRYRDDGTVEVQKWISDIQWNIFWCLAKVRKEAELENKDVLAWTKKAVEKIGRSACGRRRKEFVYKEHHVAKHRFF